jgi:hypothetical protein
MASFGGVAKTGFATLGVGFTASFPRESGGSGALNVASFGGVTVTGVATPGIGFQRRVILHPDAEYRVLKRRRDALRRFFNVLFIGIPMLAYAKCRVLTRRL